MTTTKRKKRFNPQQNQLLTIAQEFAKKVRHNTGVAAIIAKPFGTYLNLIVLLEPNIERDLQNEVFSAYGEISDKYEEQFTFELSPMTCYSSDTIDQMASDTPDNIIYRKEAIKNYIAGLP